MKKVKEDLTIGKYGTMIRNHLHGYTQTELEKEFKICRGGLSGLLRGVTFPKQEKIEALLEYLRIPVKARNEILNNINKQRLHPVIKDPIIGPRIKALRTLANMRTNELASEEITAGMWVNVEQSLVDPSAELRLVMSRRLGRSVFVTDEHRKTFEELLSKYSEEDLLTVGMFLVNKYEDLNKQNKTTW